MVKSVSVPHNFTPRDYQLPFLRAMDNGAKRAMLCWSRRHGKDKICWVFLIKAMLERVGNYAYIFPTASLARKAAWQNIDADGFRLLDHIPKELIKRKQDMQMFIELINGSTVTFFGSDRQVSVGTAYCGIVFSEFALQDRSTFDLLRPVVMQNKGFMIMNSTPRGRNHYYELWNMAQDNEDWFTSLVTADDTDVFSEKDIQGERDAGMSEELLQQELFCSFTRGVEGSFFGKKIDEARQEGRICKVVPEEVQTYAAFDLGMNDMMTIWVWQYIGTEVHFIDYYENNNEAIAHYVQWLKSKPYIWNTIFLPHDAKVRELGTGLSRLDTFKSLGINAQLVPNMHLIEGIEVVRKILPRCWFDEEKCKRGIESLECYHREWDSRNEVYRDRPNHDRYSHGADSFRYASISIAKEMNTHGSMDKKAYRSLKTRNRRVI